MAKEKVGVESESNVSELQGLMATITQLQEKVAKIEGGPETVKTKRNRVKEHKAEMREFLNEQEESLGIVTKLYKVREIKDTKENKRFYGLCSVDVLNPKTGKSETFTDVDYLQFLENAPRVLCKIDRWEKETIEAVDKREGGGGVGYYRQKDKEGNEFISDAEIEFAVTYQKHVFHVTPETGTFEGTQFVTEGLGFNL